MYVYIRFWVFNNSQLATKEMQTTKQVSQFRRLHSSRNRGLGSWENNQAAIGCILGGRLPLPSCLQDAYTPQWRACTEAPAWSPNLPACLPAFLLMLTLGWFKWLGRCHHVRLWAPGSSLWSDPAMATGATGEWISKQEFSFCHLSQQKQNGIISWWPGKTAPGCGQGNIGRKASCGKRPFVDQSRLKIKPSSTAHVHGFERRHTRYLEVYLWNDPSHES